jgi:cell division protein FtsQ
MRGVSAAPPATRRRRGGWFSRLRRLAWWAGILVVIAGAVYSTAQWSRLPLDRSLPSSALNRLIDASAALGFRVADIRVEGRATTDRETILYALGARPGTPILAVDPVRAKQQLEALPWVRSALIERRLPDTLYVRLVEREPLALWQHAGKIELIDRAGAVIPVTRLDRFAKLPLVVGEDAAGHAAELLAMLASEPELAPRVTAAVRVGGRRWNLRIDNTIDILLPADEPAAAWGVLARLQRSSAILKRDVLAVDMRMPDRLVVRVAPEPAREPATAKKGRLPAKNT